ncbi:MAG: hypothetical protein M3442_14560 [Chloroflexota bacterium]|nr:hypothetical protein [Chloroflexota bacterium]
MLLRYLSLVCFIVVALGTAGCVWAINGQREVQAVGLGGLALVFFFAAWLAVLPSAFERE